MERNILMQPGWLRGFEIVTGLLSIVMGVLVLVFPDWGVSTLVVLLSFGLMFAGFRSISLVGYSDLSGVVRAVSAISGIITLVVALLVFVFPNFGALTLILFVSSGLLVYGVSRVFLAYKLTETVGWLRGMIAAVGVVDIILSVLVVVLPGLALLTLTVILSLVLIISGAEMIVTGAVGRMWLGKLVKAAEDEMDVRRA
jgi:uncharacterized membrane protein HdeD (DUF308 family)